MISPAVSASKHHTSSGPPGTSRRPLAPGRLALLLVSLQLVSTLAPAASMAGAEAIRSRVESYRATGNLTLGGAAVASARLIPALYEGRGFEPLWTSGDRVDELIDLVGRAAEHGLDPVDYNHDALIRLRDRSDGNPDVSADLEVLLTDSLTRYGYHLMFGKVNPGALDRNWNLSRTIGGRSPVELVEGLVASDSIEHELDQLVGTPPLYEKMRALLRQYRAFAESGGWPTVSAGSTLKPGVEDSRVSELRARLAVTGDHAPRAGDGTTIYGAALEQSVRRFQKRHGLEPDGAVGPATLAALNVPVERRVDQIRINLERIRWVVRDVGKLDDFIVVNIAAFEAILVQDREIRWVTPAQVGKTYRKTPVFRAEMKYLVFNPTWTVPPTILRKDILPKARKDPGYLERKKIRVIDGSGAVIDPAGLDWGSYTGRNFPYRLRQDPGPENALGRIKFIFPNPHFVFLHDTPHREHFAKAERAFSSGCIRIENPYEMARLLLDDPEQWNLDAIERLIDSGETRSVFLDEPLPVLLLYATVAVERDEPRFLNDIYGRDPRVLAGLESPFEFVLPEDLPESYAEVDGE